MEALVQFIHALAVAILVGKVVRQLFPAYYRLGMGTAVAGFIAVNGLVAMHTSSARLMTAGGLWLLVLLTEAYCQSMLTPRSNAIRDRLKDQESRGVVDPVLQASWQRVHQRSVYLNSSVLLAGCTLMALI